MSLMSRCGCDKRELGISEWEDIFLSRIRVVAFQLKKVDCVREEVCWVDIGRKSSRVGKVADLFAIVVSVLG